MSFTTSSWIDMNPKQSFKLYIANLDKIETYPKEEKWKKMLYIDIKY